MSLLKIPTEIVMGNKKKMLTLSNEPKTIATIDVNITPKLKLIPYSFREQYLEEYTYCPLCGDELLYSHVTEFVQLSVNEEAHCESCKIRIKKNQHDLQ
jgi:formate dehydrogenase maturation protein FdhE